jgi:iron complex outermembrane receptor protein
MEPAYLYARGTRWRIEELFSWEANEKLTLNAGVNYDVFNSIPRSNDTQDPVRDGNLDDAIIVNSQLPLNPDGIPADLIERDFESIGAFLEFIFSPTPSWTVVAGTRVDNDSRYTTVLNPRLGIAYNKEGAKLNGKLMFGTAFLAPSPQNTYDRFGTFFSTDDGQSYQSAFFAMPNPGLSPQEISTLELNLTYFITEDLSLTASPFYSHVTDIISPVSSTAYPDRIESLYPGNLYVTSEGEAYPVDVMQINDNLGEQNIYGGEIGVEYGWRVAGDLNGELRLDYSYVEGDIDIDEEGPEPKRNLPGVSPHIFRFGQTLRWKKFVLDTRLTVLSKQRTIGTGSVMTADPTRYQEIDGYYILNAFIRYDVNEKLNVFVRGRNITDQRYRNVNIGARPEITDGAGAGISEFVRGAPQNPIRVELGASIKL